MQRFGDNKDAVITIQGSAHEMAHHHPGEQEDTIADLALKASMPLNRQRFVRFADGDLEEEFVKSEIAPKDVASVMDSCHEPLCHW